MRIGMNRKKVHRLPRQLKKQLINWVGESLLKLEDEYEEQIRQTALKNGRDIPSPKDHREAQVFWEKTRQTNREVAEEQLRKIVQKYQPERPERKPAVSHSGVDYEWTASRKYVFAYGSAKESGLREILQKHTKYPSDLSYKINVVKEESLNSVYGHNKAM